MIEEITFDQASEWLELTVGEPYRANELFYEGDHWQGGDGWLAQIPDEQRPTLLAQIEKAFVFKNMIGELVDRHVHSVVGREPSWDVTGEGIDTSAYNELLTRWWDNQQVLEGIVTGLPPLLYAGRAVWRLYVSPAALNTDGEVTTLRTMPTDEVGRYVYLEHLPRESAAVYHDKTTATDVGLYLYTAEDDSKVLEVSQVNANGLTEITHLAENGEILASSATNLGGRLPIYEIALSKPFVSPSMVKHQMALNLTETMISNNTYKTGFNELILFNAQLNGRMVEDENGRNVFVPDPIRRSPGAVHNFVGAKTQNGMDEQLSNPSAFQVEAFDPAGLIAVSQSSQRNLYSEGKQLHAMLSGDAVTSGEARIQAATDFETSLRPTKARVDALLRWCLATALDLQLNLVASAPNPAVRVTADARLSATVPSVELMRFARDSASQEFWSQETALVYSGIEDPGAEVERLQRERVITPRVVIPGKLDDEDDVDVVSSGDAA